MNPLHTFLLRRFNEDELRRFVRYNVPDAVANLPGNGSTYSVLAEAATRLILLHGDRRTVCQALADKFLRSPGEVQEISVGWAGMRLAEQIRAGLTADAPLPPTPAWQITACQDAARRLSGTGTDRAVWCPEHGPGESGDGRCPVCGALGTGKALDAVRELLRGGGG